MARTERFASLAEFNAEKLRLDRVRREHGESLERHWLALKDHDVRGALLRDAVGDVFRAWKPFRMISGLFGGNTTTAALGAALGGGSWVRRLFRFGMGMALPKILERLENSSGEELMHEVQVTVDRVREFLKERREKRAARRSAHTDAHV